MIEQLGFHVERAVILLIVLAWVGLGIWLLRALWFYIELRWTLYHAGRPQDSDSRR